MSTLDNIVSGQGDAVSEQTAVEENVTQVAEGEGQQEQTEVATQEEPAQGQKLVPHEALHAEKKGQAIHGRGVRLSEIQRGVTAPSCRASATCSTSEAGTTAAARSVRGFPRCHASCGAAGIPLSITRTSPG